MFDTQRGRNQAALIDDPLTRKGVELWLARVLGFYGPKGGVDVEVIDDQITLNQKTVEYLYSDYTPLGIHYVEGSRPLLEAVVAQNVKPGMTARQKALALMRRVRDNQDMGLARPSLFYGGTEEELLKRGALMCNEVSRLYVCLCQIAGVPARLHCAHISGHMMTEVHADGKWGWIDPMKGLAPVLDNDRPASAWELWQDPRLFERQPKEVWADFRSPFQQFGLDKRDPRHAAYQMAKNRDCNFHPREAQAIGNYFVWEHARYTYPWRIEMADPLGLENARHEEMLNRKALGWPLLYYHPHLFDEPLKTR
ncbi:MAG: transglutaminase domain-containing protein [Phycisphaerae bacterium]